MRNSADPSQDTPRSENPTHPNARNIRHGSTLGFPRVFPSSKPSITITGHSVRAYARSCNADRPFARLVSSPTFRRPRESPFPSNYSPCLPIADRARAPVTRVADAGWIGADRQISTWPPSRLDLSKDLARQPVTEYRYESHFFFFFVPDTQTHTSRIGEHIGWRSFSFLFCESGSSAVSNRVKWFDDRVFFFFFFFLIFFCFSAWIVDEIEMERLEGEGFGEDGRGENSRMMEILTDDRRGLFYFFVDILDG